MASSAPNNSWKQYGGRQYLYSNNHLTASSIVTDDLTILHGYQGNLEINGSLTVHNDILFYGDVDISNHHVVVGSLQVNQNAVVDGSLNVLGPLELQDGLLFGMEGSMYADMSNVVLNMLDSGLLSVVSSAPHVLKVQSLSHVNSNVIASQSTGSAVHVYADVSSSSLQFYSHYIGDGSAPDVQVELSGGQLVLDAASTHLTGGLSVLAGAVLGDVSAGSYFPSFYPIDIRYGRSLVLESQTLGGITAMEVDRSLTVSAGPFPGDRGRSFAAFSVLDVSAVPALTLVSGDSSIPATVGINTFSPMNDYALDVNGPVLLHHNQTTLVYTTSFSVLTTVFYGTSEAAMVGSAVPFLPPNANPPVPGFAHPVAYSTTAGVSWDVSLCDAAIYDLQYSSSYTAFCSIPEYPRLLFVGGEAGSFFYSNDSGAHWHQVIMVGLSYFFESLYAVLVDSKVRVFASLYYTLTNKAYLTFFDFTLSDLLDGSDSINQYPITTLQTEYLHVTQITGGVVGGMDLPRVYLFGPKTDGVSSLLTCLDISLNSPSGLFLPIVFPLNHASLFVSLTHIVVYGANLLYYAPLSDSLDFADFLNPTTSFGPSITWNRIYVLDLLHSVLVGQQIVRGITVGIIYTSQDGFRTFQVVPDVVLNSQGNSYPLLLYPLVSVYMPDLFHFVFVATYAGNVNRVFYCYWPDVFDPYNNTVLTVSGRVSVSGNLDASHVSSTYSYSSEMESPLATLGNCNVTGVLQVHDISMSQFTIKHNAAFGGNVAIGGDLSMNTAILGGRIYTSGLSNFSDLQQVGSSVFSGDASFNGTTTFHGTLIGSGPVHLSQPLIMDPFVSPTSAAQLGYTFSVVSTSPVVLTQTMYNSASFQNSSPSYVTSVLPVRVPSSGVWTVSALLTFAANANATSVAIDTLGCGLSTTASNLTSCVIPLVQYPLFGYSAMSSESFTVPVSAPVVVSGGAVTWYLNASLFARNQTGSTFSSSNIFLSGSVILTRIA